MKTQVKPWMLYNLKSCLKLFASLIIAITISLQPNNSFGQEINAGDYSSIQAAVDELPETGGAVYIPPGTHRISEPIVVEKSDVTLKGAGGSTVLLNISEESKNTIEFRGNSKEKSLWRINVRDMRFKGTERSGNAIYARWVNELSISDLWIDHHGKNGIFLYYCFENPRIHDNNIAYNRQAGIKLVGPHDIVISANELEENGVGLLAKDVFNATVTGNNIDDHTDYSIYFNNAAGSIITGNMIEESIKKGILLEESKGVVVTGNTLRHAGWVLLHLIGSLEISVSGNTFDRSEDNAIEAEKGSRNMTITGNTFSTGAFGKDGEIYGIVMHDVSNTTIANNTIIDPSEGGISILGSINSSLIIEGNLITNPSRAVSRPFSGIYVENTVNSIISGNIIRDKRAEKAMKLAIEETGKSDYNIISNNHINRGTRGALKITGRNTQDNHNMIADTLVSKPDK